MDFHAAVFSVYVMPRREPHDSDTTVCDLRGQWACFLITARLSDDTAIIAPKSQSPSDHACGLGSMVRSPQATRPPLALSAGCCHRQASPAVFQDKGLMLLVETFFIHEDLRRVRRAATTHLI